MRNRDRLVFAFGVVLRIVATLIVVAEGAQESGQSPEPAALETIRLGVLPDVDSVPFVIAAEYGFFDQEGVQVVIEKFTSPVNRDTALQAGKLDAAVSDLLAAAFAVNGGFAVKATSLTEGSYKLLAAPGTADKKIEALRGKPVGISKNTIIEYCTDRFLERAGQTPDFIHKEAIPQIPLRLEMLQAGTLAAATLPEPLASVAAAGGAVVIGESAALGINPGVILFLEEFIRENPESVKAMYRGYNRTVDDIKNGGIDRYVSFLMETLSFPEAAEKTVRGLSYDHAVLPQGTEVEQVLIWLDERELVEPGLAYTDLVDPGFIEGE